MAMTQPRRTRNGRLSQAQERALVCAAATGDRDSVEQLVVAFTPLVASVAAGYSGARAVERAELMQEGVAGLLEALRRYDPDLGTPFWAYASWWVRQAMQRLVAEIGRPAVLSDRALRQLARIREARRQLHRYGNQEPTTEELMALTELDRDKVEGLLAAERPARGLEEPIGGEDGSETTFRDMIPDPVSEDGYDRVVENFEVRLLGKLAQGLGERERTVVQARYGFGSPARTLREIAEVLNLSIERVRQIEQGALGKLRESLEANPSVSGRT